MLWAKFGGYFNISQKIHSNERSIMELMPLCGVSVPFHIPVTQPDVSSLREEILFCLTVWRYSSSWWGWDNNKGTRHMIVTLYPQSGSRERWMLGLSSLSLFHSVQNPSGGVVWPMCKVGFPTSNNLINIIPHEHGQRVPSLHYCSRVSSR